MTVSYGGRPVDPLFLRENAHQYLLQMLAELGLPAGGAWLGLILGAWYMLIVGAVRTADPEALAIGAALLAPLLLSLVAHPLLLPELAIGCAVLTGTGLGASSRAGRRDVCEATS